MSPETFGVMAQVLSVLLLAVVFSPQLRGVMRRKTLIDDEGNVYNVRPPVYWGIRYRVAMSIFSISVLLVDIYMFVSDVTAEHFAADLIFTSLNMLAAAFLVVTIATDMIEHTQAEKDERNDADRSE